MLGQKVTVKVDRPMGSYHPEHKDMYYPINYGYVAPQNMTFSRKIYTCTCNWEKTLFL